MISCFPNTHYRSCPACSPPALDCGPVHHTQLPPAFTWRKGSDFLLPKYSLSQLSRGFTTSSGLGSTTPSYLQLLHEGRVVTSCFLNIHYPELLSCLQTHTAKKIQLCIPRNQTARPSSESDFYIHISVSDLYIPTIEYFFQFSVQYLYSA